MTARRASGALLALCLVACGPKVDPLLPMKAELGQARRSPVGDAPHARVAVALGTTTDVLLRALNPEEPLLVPVGFGTAALVRPTLDRPALALKRSPACDCPQVDLRLSGTVDVDLSGLLGNAKLADDLGFQATGQGTARLSLDRAGPDGAQVLALEPEPADPFRLEIRLAESSGIINDKLVERQVVGPLTQALSQPVPLLTLPADLPIRARQVALEPASLPLAALWVEAAPAEPPPDLAIEEGWAIATTEANLLAVLRAAFATLPQTRAWRVEPIGLTVAPDRLTADLRLHKVARRPKWRTYHLEADLALGERLVVTPTSVEETGAKGFGLSLVAPFVAGRVRKQILAFRLDEAAVTTRKVGRSELSLRVDRVESDGTDVRVFGSIDAPDAAEPLGE